MTLDISTLDFISDLTSSLILKILTLMPMHDAFKTSVLSRKWRYHCLNIPKLEFIDEMLPRVTEDCHSSCITYKALLFIYTILLLHRGPVLEFSLSTIRIDSCCEIDRIILHLARNITTLEKFTLRLGLGNELKLPLSFFSLEKLTHLELQSCTLYPLTTLPTFSRLTSLYFHNVNITKGDLLLFLSRCPLITNFTLIEEDGHYFWGSGESNWVDLFHCLPSIENLHMNCCPIKLFASDVMPHKLSNAIAHLKVLRLFGLSFTKLDELRSALLLITSSPNLEKIKLEMCFNSRGGVLQTLFYLFVLQDYSYISLDHLCELEMTNFRGVKPEMDFVKVILAKSPMLEKVRLIPRCNTRVFNKRFVNNEVRILKELLELPRASSRAIVSVLDQQSDFI